MLEQKDPPALPTVQLQRISSPSPRNPDQKQRRIMLLALGLLVVALALIVVKDWEFWFPAPNSAENTAASQSSATQSSPQSSTPSASQVLRTSAPSPAGKVKPPKKAPEVAQAIPSTTAPVITNRAVLPPLEVEVVAGNTQHTVQPKNNAVNVEMQSGVPPTSPAAPATTATHESTPATNASERVRLSPNTVKAVTRPVQPNYPMLAKQMKVQGAVVLQAFIANDGSIQDLHVLSGPSILSAAALEAVKQWHFKPYYQNGQAVDTEARITVNFTISTY